MNYLAFWSVLADSLHTLVSISVLNSFSSKMSLLHFVHVIISPSIYSYAWFTFSSRLLIETFEEL